MNEFLIFAIGLVAGWLISLKVTINPPHKHSDIWRALDELSVQNRKLWDRMMDLERIKEVATLIKAVQESDNDHKETNEN